MDYPQINPVEQEKGSPEMALAEYLFAWQGEDWAKMGEHSQSTWVSQDKEAISTLEAQHEPIKIKGAEINGQRDVPSLNNDVCRDLIATIYYTVPLGGKKFRDKVKKKKILARVICETSPFKTSKNGKWGVNPISALRKA